LDGYHARTQAMEILSEESRLSQIVKLVGSDPLPTEQRLILETARVLREGFLQQNALDEVDAYSNAQKQVQMLAVILHFHQRAQRIIKRGAHIAVIHDLPVVNRLIRMKEAVRNDKVNGFNDIRKEIDEEMDKLELEYQ
jgi:V/A-type H+-transporting ATPase subunit A